MSGPIPVITPKLQRQSSCACGGGCSKCLNKKESLHAKHVPANKTVGNTAQPAVNEVLRSPGQPLDGSTREFMESRFEHDFSRVRVHTDSKAIEATQSVNALAFTVGHNIAFDKGQYAPETIPGKRLLAHELTHVTQQHGNRNILQKFSVDGGDQGDAHEREAEQIAGDIEGGGPIPKRCPKPEVGKCNNGKWKFEYDGCSKPWIIPNAVKFNYNNPTRGKDTHFSKCGPSDLACDQHDECYQTFGADKDRCDRVFLLKMLKTCSNSKEGREVKDQCRSWAFRYFQAVHLFGGGAYRDQQKRVGECRMALEYGTYFNRLNNLA
jgi:hypothetical protein